MTFIAVAITVQDTEDIASALECAGAEAQRGATIVVARGYVGAN